MSREVRMVPSNWIHPKDARGSYIPLHTDFTRCLSEWNEGKEKWDQGLVSDFQCGWKAKPKDINSETFEEWSGNKPKQEEYMPEWLPGECTHFMMYETCSEGTPISPAFASPEELAHWLSDNGASAFGDMTATFDQWLATIKRGRSISAVLSSHGLESGVTAEDRLEKENKS